jgi:methylated-DNA-[protein]-cysteine S-methyltransferase
MAMWILIEGRLADGFPMRMYLAEHAGKLWSASMHDDEHPFSEDDFASRLSGHGNRRQFSAGDGAASDVLSTAAEQVLEYFAGRRLNFNLPLSLRGTLFQVRVWQELLQIPFGTTRTYGDIAEIIGHPTAFRAVGSANGRNNLPVFIPCHRVLAAGGKLGGFTGGIGLKKRLLAHEASVLSAAAGD